MNWQQINKTHVIKGLLLSVVFYVAISLPISSVYPNNLPVEDWLIFVHEWLVIPLSFLFFIGQIINPMTKEMRMRKNWFGTRCLLASYIFSAVLATVLPRLFLLTLPFLSPILIAIISIFFSMEIGFPLGSLFSYITFTGDKEK